MKFQPTVHFQLTVTVNENQFQWADPRGQVTQEFDMPMDMVHLPLVNKRLADILESAREEYEKALKALEVSEETE